MAQPTPNGNRQFDDPNYIDVAERIANFNERYPDGTLQTIEWDVVTVAEQTFVVYRAAAYRTPDDPRPGMGIAWEPYPGKTPYTHDSELMNAETAAWGRAIVACGLTSNRKIASLQEVQARAGENGSPPQPMAQVTVIPSGEPVRDGALADTVSGRPCSYKQRKMIRDRFAKAGLTPTDAANVVLVALDREPVAWKNEDAATRWLGQQLDRLLAAKVDAVLEGIEKS